MLTNFSRTTLALLTISFLLFSCRKHRDEPRVPWQLTEGLGVSYGSTVGPDGKLYVPDAQAGIIYSIDPKTGDRSAFASGLPKLNPGVGIGGVMDLVFLGGKAYALVTLVDDALFPTGQINGIYRIDGPNSFKVIVDIGAFNLAHPPTGFPFDIATGVLYSIDTYRGGFLVTDGHLNRVLQVTPGGEITLFHSFKTDVVPTGLAVNGNMINISQAGPAPHLPEDGKVVLLDSKAGPITVASGARLLVDVEFGPGHSLFALSQGVFGGGPDGSPALPNTGSLERVNANGTFSEVADELNIPTSLELIDNTAYIVTLAGEVWVIDIGGPQFGWPIDN